MLATRADLARYVDPRAFSPLDVEWALVEASLWVQDAVVLNGHVPPAVSEATALMAALLLSGEQCLVAPPKMVELMIYPHRPYSSTIDQDARNGR